MAEPVSDFLDGIGRHMLHVTAEQACGHCHGPAQSGPPVTLAMVYESLQSLHQKADRIMSEQSTTQADVDAATALLTQIQSDVAGVVTTLGSDFTAIEAEIASLQAQGVNTSALDAAVASAKSTVAGLDPAVAQITSLVPAPAPAPAEPSASSEPAAS